MFEDVTTVAEGRRAVDFSVHRVFVQTHIKTMDLFLYRKLPREFPKDEVTLCVVQGSALVLKRLSIEKGESRAFSSLMCGNFFLNDVAFLKFNIHIKLVFYKKPLD